SPAITTDAAGNQYALYAKGSSGSATLQFLYKPNGGSWGSPTNLGGTDVKTPRLDMSSSGYLQVVYVDGNEVYYRSRTPAGVWSAATLISAADSIESINPDIAVDGGNGKIHIVWQDRASGNAQIMYKGFESGAWGANTTISSRSDDDLSPRVEFGTGG